MIINRQFIKEILKTSVAVLFILVSIFLVIRMVAFLKAAAEGNIPLNSIFILLSFKLMTYIDVILPLIVYVAILLVLNRWNKDNEMPVISASGISLFNFLKPGAILSAIFVLLVTWFSLDIAPWAVRKGIEIEDEFRQSRDIAGVVPGSFTEVQQGKGVYFLERFNKETKNYEEVFAHSQLPNEELIVSGEYAYRFINEEHNAEYLVVKNGTRYDIKSNNQGYKITDFEEYALLIKPTETATISYPLKGYTTTSLIVSSDPILNIEFVWRLSKIVVVPVLILFAISLSRIEVRRSRMSNMLVAFFMYFAYTNTNTFMIAMLKKGTLLSSWPIWTMHFAYFLLALYFLFQSANNRPIIPRFKS